MENKWWLHISVFVTVTDQQLSKKKKFVQVYPFSQYHRNRLCRRKTCADLNKIPQTKPSPSTKLIGSMSLAIIVVIRANVFSGTKLVDHLMYCLAVKWQGIIVSDVFLSFIRQFCLHFIFTNFLERVPQRTAVVIF